MSSIIGRHGIPARIIRQELAEMEDVIERNLASYAEMGYALSAIREKKLYRVDYKNWKDYCAQRWGVHKTTIDRKIAKLLPDLSGSSMTQNASSSDTTGSKLEPTRLERFETCEKRVGTVIEEATRMLDCSKKLVDEGRMLWLEFAKWAKAVFQRPDRPIAEPFRKKCKDCSGPITIAMTENRRWMALDDSQGNGRWDIIENMACMVEDGPFRRHAECCTNAQTEADDEPIPD